MTVQHFPGGTVEGAIRDPSQRRAFYQHMLDIKGRLSAILQINLDNPSSPNLLAAPPPAQFTVKGQDGNFSIKITNPQDIDPLTVNQLQLQATTPLNPSGAKIQHRLQKSTEESFSTPSLITELPLTYDTDIVDKDPNATKFWRLQSRYDGGDYNAWQWWNDPASCGPVSVWAGLLASSSNDLINSAATPSDGLVALSQDGVTTNILIAAKTWNVGNQQIAYNSGHVDPGAFGSYLIYAVDLKRAGGAVTYIATLHIQDLTAQDGIIYFGNIKTTNAGGGSVSGGGQGGGGCTRSGSLILRMDGSETAVELLKRGDVVQGVDGGPEVLQADPIPRFCPCFRFVSGDLVLECSNTHPFLQPDGKPEKATEIHPPYEVMSKNGNARIASREYIGEKLVWELKLDRTRTYRSNGFWAHNKFFIPQ